MGTEAAKVGRNELCACGSGRKYKRCCGAVATSNEDAAGRFFGIAAVLVGVMLLGGTAVFARALFTEEAPQKVWSAEHGHWHTVGGSETAKGSATRARPLETAEPSRGALEGLRTAELDAARARAESSK